MRDLDYQLVQLRLKKHAFDPGSIDGIRGPRTINAIKRFQESRGLIPDGIVGPKTYEVLFGETVSGEAPQYDLYPWLDYAKVFIGTKEVAGTGDNPEILRWADVIGSPVGIDYNADSIHWCGLFAGFVVSVSLPDEVVPNICVRAKEWLNFGIGVEAQVGAVLVFSRTGGGHVGFCVGESGGDYLVLGGNQSDAVNVSKYSKSRLLGARWPTTSLMPTGEVNLM